MAAYAEKTKVPASQSRMEIERILERYGATAFASGWKGNVAVITFEASGRRIRFTLPIPDKADKEFKRDPRASWRVLTDHQAQEKWEQVVRQKWRAMALAIKAKLEVVESGIATFEEEFMAHIVLPNGSNVGEWMKPQLQGVYDGGAMPPLLTSGKTP